MQVKLPSMFRIEDTEGYFCSHCFLGDGKYSQSDTTDDGLCTLRVL